MCWPERADAWVVIVSTVSGSLPASRRRHKRENCLWPGFTVEVELKVIGSSE